MLKSKALVSMAIVGFAFCSVPLVTSCRTNEPVGEQMSDAGITSKIKAKYVVDPDVKALNVSVTTEEGVVYLTGRVESAYQRDKAERIAEETHGVRRVVNHIQVGQSG